MKKLLLSLVTASSFVCTMLPASAQSNAWMIDPAHSSVNFSVRHMMLASVSGQFHNVSGTVQYDGKDMNNAAVDAVIAANSIDTQIKARDEHLCGSVFNVAQFPSISFKSKEIEPEANGHFRIVGTLNMHGIAKDVTLEADPLAPITTDAEHNEHTSTTATAQVNRKDYGLLVDKALDHGGAMVGDSVQITLNIALTKPSGK